MAMIKCPECGKEISENATSCPNCGNPVKKVQTPPSTPNFQGPVKMCKKCKEFMPKNYKICPKCGRKQGGILKWFAIGFIVLIVIGAAIGRNDSEDAKNDTKKTTTESNNASSKKEEESKEIEYISVTATQLSDELSNNAMKAQNDYKGKYIEVSGKLGNIDSSGKYIGIDSDKDFDFTNIQCYIKSDEQKEKIMNMSKGDAITIKGYCKDVGELLGYSIDINEIN